MVGILFLLRRIVFAKVLFTKASKQNGHTSGYIGTVKFIM